MTHNSGHAHIRLVDVAKASGYSVSTVSIVLNDTPLSRKIAPSTRERVRATARQLGYHPDWRARALRSGQSGTVAVVAFNLLSPVCISIVGGIMDELQKAAYMPLLVNIESEPEQLKSGLNLTLEWRAEAVILLADSFNRAMSVLAELKKFQMPVVAVGSDLTSQNTSSIVVDRISSGLAAVHHLSKLGHKDIAFILSAESRSESEAERQDLFRRAAAMGLHIDPDLVLQLSPLQKPEVRCGAGRKFLSEMLEKRKNFTAIVSFDDWAAAGVTSELTHRALKVPQDCSIIVVAHLISSTSAGSDLSVIRPSYGEIGRQAAQWTLSAVRGRKQKEEISSRVHRQAPDLSILSASSIAAPSTSVTVR